MVIAAFSEVMTGAFPEEVEGPTFQNPRIDICAGWSS